MKNLLNYSKLWTLLFGLSILFLTSCDTGEEEEPAPEPTASFTFSPAEPEVGQEVTFTSTSENASSFTWAFDDGNTATGENTVHTYQSAGEFTVTLVATGEGGNVSVEQTVTISAIGPSASFTFSPAEPNVGQEITFTSTSENANSFSWDFDDGSSATGESAVHTYESAGEFTVTLVASGDGGDVTITETVLVAELPLEAETVEIYFADNTGDVFTMQKISGLGLETTVETAFETTGYTIQVFYDENSGKIYYSDDDNGQVVRVNTDGSEEEIVAEGIIEPRGVAVNNDATQLFVADRGADEILSFDLATGVKTVLYDSTALANVIGGGAQPDVFWPEGLTFHNGELFFTCVEVNAEAIWKGAADGSSLERLLDFGAAGWGYAVIVDTESSMLIFDNTDSNNLVSSEFDGSNRNEIVSTDDYTYGIGIDYETSKLYWSTRDGSVKRANRDGSEVETLVSADEGRVNRGLVVVPTN